MKLYFTLLFAANIVCICLFFLTLLLMYTTGLGKNLEDWIYIAWSIVTFHFDTGIEKRLEDWGYVARFISIFNWLGVINIVSMIVYLVKRRPKVFYKQLIVLWTILFSVLYFAIGYFFFG